MGIKISAYENFSYINYSGHSAPSVNVLILLTGTNQLAMLLNSKSSSSYFLKIMHALKGKHETTNSQNKSCLKKKTPLHLITIIFIYLFIY